MAPRLQVLAGTSLDALHPITSLVNANEPYTLASDLFEGEVVVNIKGLINPVTLEAKEPEYFSRPDRQGITWSIQVRGRFLVPHSADDILFGNIFERPLNLPWGSGAAFKFMQYIDPTLEHDLTSPTKPWALSPLIATMPHLMHTRLPIAKDDHCGELSHLPTYKTSGSEDNTTALSKFPPSYSIMDDTSQLHLTLKSTDSSISSGSDTPSSSASSTLSTFSYMGGSAELKPRSSMNSLLEESKALRRAKRKKPKMPSFANASQRRSYFSKSAHREAVQLGPEDVITTDFCYGFLEFNPTLALRLPGGLTFDLMKYWDGQPVRFVCCERKESRDEGEDPWGRIFWCVSIEIDEDVGSQSK